MFVSVVAALKLGQMQFRNMTVPPFDAWFMFISTTAQLEDFRICDFLINDPMAHRDLQHVKNWRYVHCTEAGIEGLFTNQHGAVSQNT